MASNQSSGKRTGVGGGGGARIAAGAGAAGAGTTAGVVAEVELFEGDGRVT